MTDESNSGSAKHAEKGGDNDSKKNGPHPSPGKKLLEQAYLLETPDDNVAYYNKLADTYDADFAQGLGYALPDAVADVYRARVNPEDTPTVDIGCGTGLMGKALMSADLTMDGIDISEAMLSHSRKTGTYRDLLNVDLTGDITDLSNKYGAVISSGTFTHGHLGPDVLVQLLSMAKPGGLFVIAINQTHYESKGFDEAVNVLVKAERINALMSEQVNIYNRTDHAHSSDNGLIVSFRKC